MEVVSRERKWRKLILFKMTLQTQIPKHPRKANAKKGNQQHQQLGGGPRDLVNWNTAPNHLPGKQP